MAAGGWKTLPCLAQDQGPGLHHQTPRPSCPVCARRPLARAEASAVPLSASPAPSLVTLRQGDASADCKAGVKEEEEDGCRGVIASAGSAASAPPELWPRRSLCSKATETFCLQSHDNQSLHKPATARSAPASCTATRAHMKGVNLGLAEIKHALAQLPALAHAHHRSHGACPPQGKTHAQPCLEIRIIGRRGRALTAAVVRCSMPLRLVAGRAPALASLPSLAGCRASSPTCTRRRARTEWVAALLLGSWFPCQCLDKQGIMSLHSAGYADTASPNPPAANGMLTRELVHLSFGIRRAHATGKRA